MKNTMKKAASSILVFLFVFTITLQFPATAHAASFDGFEYTVVGGTTITITGYTGPNVVVVPPSIEGKPVTKIGDNAFREKGITSITIPEPVSAIGTWAFYDCRDLSTVYLPNTLRSIGDNAFLQCFYMSVIDLPDGLQTIGMNAFFYCYGLERVTIPASVTSIGASAYGMAACLMMVKFEGNAPVCYTSSFRDTWIQAIYYKEGATGFTTPTWKGYPTVMIPTGLQYESIPPWNTRITGYTGSTSNLALPSSIDLNPVTEIGSNAFTGNSSLTSVTIPDSVTRIGGGAFANCTNLSSVSLPTNLNTIEANAFEACTSLTGMTIPANVTGIGDSAFSDCTSLASLRFLGNLPAAPANAINGTDTDIVFTAGATGLDAAPWNTLNLRPLCIVSFDPEDGTAPPSAQAKFHDSTYGKAADGIADQPLPALAARTGYTFEGWWTGDNGTGELVTDSTAMTSMVNHTLYAKWTGVPITGLPADYTMYNGGRVSWDPQPEGGEWDWDETFFSATFNSPATFKALKEGTSTITYTANGITQSISVTINKALLPATGQNTDMIWLLGMLAVLCGGGTMVLRYRKKIFSGVHK